eukprot:scaffold25328_cov49-Phaeocystis_antarctica.AAC.1
MASLSNAAAYVVAFGLQTLLVFAGNSRFFGLLKEGSGWRTNVEMSVPLRVDTAARSGRGATVRTPYAHQAPAYLGTTGLRPRPPSLPSPRAAHLPPQLCQPPLSILRGRRSSTFFLCLTLTLTPTGTTGPLHVVRDAGQLGVCDLGPHLYVGAG